MIVSKRVFSDELSRIIESHLSSKEVYMSVFIMDIINLLNESIVVAAASAKAISNNVDMSDEDKMSLYKSKFTFLKDEPFLFDRKTGFIGEIDKNLYVKEFLKMVMSEKLSNDKKALAITIEVEAIKRAMKEHFSKNYVSKAMNKTCNSRSNIHKFLTD